MSTRVSELFEKEARVIVLPFIGVLELQII